MAPLTVVIAVLAVLALARVGELLWSKKTAALARSRDAHVMPEPLFVFMVVLHVLPFVLIPLEVWYWSIPIRPSWLIPSAAVLSLAVMLRVYTLRSLGKSWNVRIVAPGQVVTRGPYRFIRHPNYLVVILELASLPLLFGAWRSALFLTVTNGVILYLRIGKEEEVLFAVPGYKEAMGAKKRFIPGLF